MPQPSEHPDSNVLAAIEAFKIAQEAYVGYATPETVSYANLCIPFSYSSPVEGVTSSGFGYRVHPIEGQVLFHYGTDYDVEEGTEVLAFADGVVTALGEESGYGKYICVEHDDGWETLYAHCSEISVSSGQAVSGGEVLGKSGSTGRVTGPHLHFELMHNDLYTNPEFFLP
jgi:murein DD-endopeptidase MepM/ murein hydrolase activator NlpD